MSVTIQRVEIQRGRMDETEKCAVGTCRITGTDTDGTMDPTNPGSPFVGNLNPTKQVAFAVMDPNTSLWYTRFTGKWDTLTYTIDASGKFATFELDCVDDLDILSDAEVIPGAAGTTVPAGSEGNAFYSAQAVNDRILAAIADSSTSLLHQTWPGGLLDIFTGNVDVQDSVYSPRSPLLQVIQDACDAEFPFFSNFFVSVTGQLTFRGRFARFNPTDAHYGISHWQLGDATAFASNSLTAVLGTDGSSSPIQFTRGKQNLLNAVLCTPQGIAATDIAGQLVTDATSYGAYGVRSISYEGLLTLQGHETPPLDANAETALMSDCILGNYKDPTNRPKSLMLRSYPVGHPWSVQNWKVLRAVELSDYITLTTTHPGGGGFAGDNFFVEQITETHLPRRGENGGDDVTMTLEVSPAPTYNPFTGDTGGS